MQSNIHTRQGQLTTCVLNRIIVMDVFLQKKHLLGVNHVLNQLGRDFKRCCALTYFSIWYDQLHAKLFGLKYFSTNDRVQAESYKRWHATSC